ncbi:MAG: dephospho-CoA kinase [Clostridiales bacterium]|nr:dephospho-CoA kinase [Clostridiales bacterium]
MKKNIVIGLTGKTGAGKSTASEYFKNLGAWVIDADITAHTVMNSSTQLKKELSELFGSDVINQDGSINRVRLAQTAFSSGENTQKLNAAAHPRILEAIQRELDTAFARGYKTAVVDAAALFESGGEKMCDFVICVTAPREIRLERILERDGISRERALERIDAQQSDAFYESRSDFTVKNYEPYSIDRELDKAMEKIRGLCDESEK